MSGLNGLPVRLKPPAACFLILRAGYRPPARRQRTVRGPKAVLHYIVNQYKKPPLRIVEGIAVIHALLLSNNASPETAPKSLWRGNISPERYQPIKQSTAPAQRVMSAFYLTPQKPVPPVPE